MAEKIVLASRNKKKIAELKAMLAGLPFDILSVESFDNVDEVEETGVTFKENAVLKAESVSAATGHMAFADDSGLEADYLEGAPGVFSARFSGDGADDASNNRLLLEKLKGVTEEKRTAAFCCVIALAAPGKKTVTFEGSCSGRILEKPVGTNGFGYDPLFYSFDTRSSFAEAGAEEKNKVSHRAKALVKLKKYLEEIAGGKNA